MRNLFKEDKKKFNYYNGFMWCTIFLPCFTSFCFSLTDPRLVDFNRAHVNV